MLRRIHDRVNDLESSDRSDEAPRLIRTVINESGDNAVVTLSVDDPPELFVETSGDSDNVTMTLTEMQSATWNESNWNTSMWS